MHSGLLRGRDHLELGAVAAISQGAGAVTLSKGGAAKTYSHAEPNEDAALFALGDGGMLVAVGDGHDGAAASEHALSVLLERWVPDWTAEASPCASHEDWSSAALSAIEDANDCILADAREADRSPSHTTLAFALIRPREDLLLYASIGDSHIFQCGREGVDELTPSFSASGDAGRAFYLGYPTSRHFDIRRLAIARCDSLAGTRAVVLATDGLSEYCIGVEDPVAAVSEAVARAAAHESELRPLEVARELAEVALQAQRENAAGDNVAVASLWLE